MGRLIEANALLSEMEKYSDDTARSKNEYLFGMQQRLETCIELVEDAPTVDAVPVVRCKDCRYWDISPASTAAPAYHECRAKGISATADDFCSRGERKDEKDGDTELLKGDKNMCDYKIFSKMLKEQLKKKSMTQKELAERIDTTGASMSRYVSGQRIPKATVLLKIATALGVSTDYLLGVEEKDGDHHEG